MTLEADVQQGWHDAIVEMHDIDLSSVTGDAEDIYYFTEQLKEDGTKVQWKGNVYEPFSIISAGYDRNTNGQIARPTLTVANVLGTFTQVVRSFDDLVGGKITRRRTLQKYLDGSPQADTLQEFPIDIFYIERKTQETAASITWQLSSVLDLEGVKLPRRVVTQNLCLWRYRSSECSYTGPPVFDSRDQALSTTGQTAEATAVVNAWRLREQRKAELEAALQSRNQAIGSQEAACSPFTFLEAKYSRESAPVSLVKKNTSGEVSYTAIFDGIGVSLGTTYRQGRVRETFEGGFLEGIFYEIERWGPNTVACTNATNALIAAEASLAVAQGNLSSAESALSAAMAALPANDPLRLSDVCGKRVSSCALRFPGQSLPFGGFPGANLTRG